MFHFLHLLLLLLLQTVNYDSKRGGISVMVERGPETTLSSLLIQKATRKGPFFHFKSIFYYNTNRIVDHFHVNFILDSGIYVCSPSSAPAASTSIHVLEGNFKLKIKTK